MCVSLAAPSSDSFLSTAAVAKVTQSGSRRGLAVHQHIQTEDVSDRLQTLSEVQGTSSVVIVLLWWWRSSSMLNYGLTWVSPLVKLSTKRFPPRLLLWFYLCEQVEQLVGYWQMNSQLFVSLLKTVAFQEKLNNWIPFYTHCLTI